MISRFKLLFAFLFLFSFQTFAQKKVESKILQLEMKDGNTVQGKLIEKRSDSLSIKTTTFGVLNLAIKDIKTVNELDAERFKDGEYWFENPHATRGFFAPTGFGLKKGEGYYNNVYVLFNSVTYGFTDNFSMGVGILPIFVSSGLPLAVYVTPKVTFNAGENFHAGVGVLAGSFGASTDRVSAGIAYGIGTFGNHDDNLTLGIGYGYANGSFASVPLINVAGQKRIARKVSLITENYFISSGGTSILFGVSGVRIMNPNVSFDICLPYAFSSGGGFSPIPVLSLTLPFGRKKL